MDITDIGSPEMLKQLNRKQLTVLAGEIRSFLIGQVARTGGHLGSNLGVCELTVALHATYNSPKDKLIWDIGHQTYVHKILTGRADMLPSLRQKDGMSGFLRREESVHDIWEAGHSSTSISAALGHAIARDLSGGEEHVAAIIGDGALTGGMAMEALNHLGASGKRLTIILNDNGMSISPNVGALKLFFEDGDIEFRKRFFEKVGFHYIGPVNGHDMNDLLDCLERAKRVNGPVFIHVLTEKGKGWLPAENDHASKGHGVSAFNASTGEPLSTKEPCKDYSETVADELVKIAASNPFTVITPAMSLGSKLTKFEKKFPERFVDTGIAEQHAITLAAGIANAGEKVFVPVYSTFLQRGYDQVVHDVCRQNLNVAFGIDRSGFSGADGDSHHGVFDISFLRSLPNMVLMMPSNHLECTQMTRFALSYNKGPIAIRYPRGAADMPYPDMPTGEIKLGRWQIMREGKDAAILAVGPLLKEALKAAERLSAEGFSVMVVNARFIKPLDRELLMKLWEKEIPLVTLEEGVLAGGFGSAVLEFVADQFLNPRAMSISRLGLDDRFYGQGTDDEMRCSAGLTAETIAEQCVKIISECERVQ